MTPLRLLAAVFVVIDVAPAQLVSMSVSALTPLSVQITSGSQTSQLSVPAGPLALGGSVMAGWSPGTLVAGVEWNTNSTGSHPQTFAQVWLDNCVFALGGPAASGVAGPHEFLLEFTASAPAAATLLASRTSELTPGMPWPTVDVDFGNDGTIDLPNLSVASPIPVTLGLQPLRVRVILATVLPSNGSSYTRASFEVRPANNVSIVQAAAGCAPAPSNHALSIAPAFANAGVGLDLVQSQDLTVLVLGLAQQPLLLPGGVLAPCLVVPAPDVLLVVPPSVYFWSQVPLPAAVRPVTFHAQAVRLAASGLLTTDAFSVVAF